MWSHTRRSTSEMMLIVLLMLVITAIVLWPMAKWIELHVRNSEKVLIEHARRR